jgi:hypothetical protein
VDSESASGASVTASEPATLSSDQLKVLEAQLERMRSMLYGYYDQFYRFLNIHLVSLFALIAVGLWGVERIALLLPFYVVFIGFHAAYLYSYVIFARTYATAIERRINTHLGGTYLVAHELEAAYIFPVSRRRFVAFSSATPGSFLSAETIMCSSGGALLFGVLAVWATRHAIDAGSLWGALYAVTLAAWSAGSLGYLAWYHLRGDYEQRLQTILTARYNVSYREDDQAL